MGSTFSLPVPVIFLTVMTPTLISLSTPSPLATIPTKLSMKETVTMKVSNKLNLSYKYLKLEAKVFMQISTRNKLVNIWSIIGNTDIGINFSQSEIVNQ